MKLRNLLWIAPFLLGLGVAWCGVQLTDAASDPVPASVDAAPSTSTPLSSTTTRVSIDPADTDTNTEPDGLALSPLATVVTELPNAFPETVLEGLGDPIGVPPTGISIPSLGVSTAPILPVGLETNGELEVPGASEVGWYEFGAGVDGGEGSAVLAAHIAFNGRDGVFRNLAELGVGAEIVVTDGGETLNYVVTDLIQYDKDQLPIRELFRESGPEQLVLITCGGSFNPNIRSYDDNVVAIAVQVE